MPADAFVSRRMQALDLGYFICVVVEYVRSLHLFRLPVHIYLQQFLITVLVKNRRHHILHQFLQYHVISDSEMVALQLLSLESEYAPAYQVSFTPLSSCIVSSEYRHSLVLICCAVLASSSN